MCHSKFSITSPFANAIFTYSQILSLDNYTTNPLGLQYKIQYIQIRALGRTENMGGEW